MTTYLFSTWISHFVTAIRKVDDISPQNRHLLVFDGHNSHCTLEVANAAKAVGLDLITLPSHSSHVLQPLDVSVLRPFKQHFREYRDFWMSRNLDQPAKREILAQWVSLALKKALTSKNIENGFRATGIYPLNRAAVEKIFSAGGVSGTEGAVPAVDAVGEDLADVTEVLAWAGDPLQSPSRPGDTTVATATAADTLQTQFAAVETESGALASGSTSCDPRPVARQETFGNASEGNGSPQRAAQATLGTGFQGLSPLHARHATSGNRCEGLDSDLHAERTTAEVDDVAIEMELDHDFREAPSASTSHFFVALDGSPVEADEEIGLLDPTVEEPESRTQFLQLPSVTARTSGRHRDPVMEFSKSIIITSAEYIEAAHAIKTARENDKKAKELAKQSREEMKKTKAIEREEERARKVVEREASLRRKEERAVERAATQARKAVEREVAQRAKAVRIQEKESAKLAKAAERARIASERCESRRTRAVETMQGRQTRVQNMGVEHLQETHFSQAPQIPPCISQVPLPHFMHHQGPVPFIFSSPSNLPHFSQSNVRPESTLPILQLNTHSQVSGIQTHSTHPWHITGDTGRRR
jgi:flagellar biosynthesis GTPase FlhF